MRNSFHFIKNKKVAIIVVAVVLVVGIASFIIRGFNIDIDFSGGTEIQLNIGTEVTGAEVTKINNLIKNNANLGQQYVSSTTKSTSNSNIAIIRTGTSALTPTQQDALEADLKATYPKADFNDKSITVISPSIGASTTEKALLAVAIAIALMLTYIWIRFELASGLASIICLAHDLFVMLTIYSLFQIPINSNIIAAFLTILGYSINATIIIFDRVRENKRKYSGEKDFADIVDLSTHQTLRRSLFTTITTLLTIGMIFIMGVESIRNFAFPLCVGIVAGLFSSCCLSGLLWFEFSKVIKPRKDKKLKGNNRAVKAN